LKRADEAGLVEDCEGQPALEDELKIKACSPDPNVKTTKTLIGRRRSRRPDPGQHPLQMLLIFRSTVEPWEFSDRISASPCIDGPGVAVPSIRPLLVPPARLPGRPTVVDPCGPPLD
jgi:hypothetical protein